MKWYGKYEQENVMKSCVLNNLEQAVYVFENNMQCKQAFTNTEYLYSYFRLSCHHQW